MQVPIDEVRVETGTLVWRDPATGERYETPVTGGHAKLQWKPDWAMRWVALGVDYEMAGKDLIDSVKLSGKIARALGGEPPDGFNYELFLDEKGQKISKSKGNGLTIDEWLKYGTRESLGLFMYNKPREAKRLFFDVIPRHVDEYIGFLDRYAGQDAKLRLGNPVWHLHAGNPPEPERVEGASLTFAMLLNLAAVANTEDPAVLWGFIRRYAPQTGPETHRGLDRLVVHALTYFPTSCARPRPTASPPRRSGRPWRICRRPLRHMMAPPTRRPCRRRSTRSGGGTSRTCPARPRARTGAPACRRPGSRACTTCCSARRGGRASAPSWPCTGWRRPGR